jgi:hypothetical protein
MQAEAIQYAAKFNKLNPPKPVNFLKASIIQTTEGYFIRFLVILLFITPLISGLIAIEEFINGDYIKYNNNADYVEEKLRNTPQAFSHFTYEFSNHALVIVDIQGKILFPLPLLKISRFAI